MKNDGIKELTSEFMSGNTDDIVDIITFCESVWGIQFNLFPVQKFILKCLYGLPLDGINKLISVPDDTNDKVLFEFTEVEFLFWLHENKLCNVSEIPANGFQELIWVAGRRSGKSNVSAAIGSYELYKLVKRGNPSQFYGFPTDSNIDITIVAPTDDQAGISFDMLMSKVLSCSYLQNRCVNQTMTYFNVQTDSDKANAARKRHASLSVLTGGCSSNSLRGRNNIIIILDEMAFFIDNNGRFSGAEIYKALKPSTASFRGDGKVIGISSPYAKYGSFYDRYVESFNEKETTLMFQMYSALVNPELDSAFLRAERRRNRASFNCEYGGKFSDNVTAWVDDEERFQACIKTDKKSAEAGILGNDYFMGIDLGLKNDGTALAISHRDPRSKIVYVDYFDVWFSGSSDVWEIENSMYHECNRFVGYEIIPIGEIVKIIQDLCKWFPIKSGWFDQYNGYALHEQLHALGLKQFHMEQVTDKINSEIYQIAKTLYGEGMIEFPDEKLLIDEILQLEAEKRSRNQVKVRAPNKRGAHDDTSDAVVRSIFEAYTHGTERGQNIVAGQTSIIGSNAGTMNQFKMKRAKQHGIVTARSIPKLTRRFR